MLPSSVVLAYWLKPPIEGEFSSNLREINIYVYPSCVYTFHVGTCIASYFITVKKIWKEEESDIILLNYGNIQIYISKNIYAVSVDKW
jgi:hypothetical protein